MAKADGLLVKVRGDSSDFAARTRSLRIGKVDVEPILSIPPQPGGMGAAADHGATWLKISASNAQSDNPWDDAHRIVGRTDAFAAALAPVAIRSARSRPSAGRLALERGTRQASLTSSMLGSAEESYCRCHGNAGGAT